MSSIWCVLQSSKQICMQQQCKNERRAEHCQLITVYGNKHRKNMANWISLNEYPNFTFRPILANGYDQTNNNLPTKIISLSYKYWISQWKHQPSILFWGNLKLNWSVVFVHFYSGRITFKERLPMHEVFLVICCVNLKLTIKLQLTGSVVGGTLPLINL